MSFWKILNIDLTNNTSEITPLSPEWKYLGGRAFTSQIVSDLVPADCNPVGKKNILVIATGLLAGSGASSSYRVSIGAKSPLTGGIKESNSGGRAGFSLSMLGLRGIIIKGISPAWQILIIDKKGVRFDPAGNLVGQNIFSTTEILRKQYGDKSSVIVIGTAGEYLLKAACIGLTDNEGVPARHAGRGGLGAVMGSKHLKAIIIDESGGSLPQPFDQKVIKSFCRVFSKELLNHPTTNFALPRFGTAVMVDTINAVGGLPTRNYSQGQFEGASRIDGQALYDLIATRNGKPTHSCMPGCVVRCSNIILDRKGNELNRALEYETIGLLGSNCGIDDLDTINTLNRVCDDIGLDTIEIGAAIGVAMEAGVITFGDGEKMFTLFDEIKKFSPLGRILGNGALITGKEFKVARIPVVKGQAMAAYDPRALKGIGVTYATSPMGADHTAGNVLPGAKLPDGTLVDTTSAEHQVELSRFTQLMATIFDMLGLCWFTKPPIFEDISIISNILSAYCGENWDEDRLMKIAKQTIATEIAFNRAAGFTEEDDDLPEFFRKESLDPNKFLFDVEKQALLEVHKDL